MKKYEYVSIELRGVFTGKFEPSHREIIDDYAKRGFKYVGFIPTKYKGSGCPIELDLVFEKDIEER